MSPYQHSNMNHTIYFQFMKTFSQVLPYLSQVSSANMSPTTATPYSSNYERMSGNCTRLLAAQLISDISPPITPTSYILDNACGPGIVSEQIKLLHPDARILAADVAPGMINEVKHAVATNGWSNMSTEILDIRDLKTLEDGTFSHVIMNLGMPVPGDLASGPKIVKEMFRVLKIGGVAVVSTWADRVWLSAFHNSALAIRPNETPDSFMTLAPELLRASWLVRQLEEGGFGNNIEVKPCVTYTTATSLEELTGNMMLAKGMFFSRFTEEEIERVEPILREELGRLRTFERWEGGVRVGMKAWIGVGRKMGDEEEV
ncbi:S-adenosyl-L-methionine-dependent methyltransferase, partial [Stipitochalara longipes BDJ]